MVILVLYGEGSKMKTKFIFLLLFFFLLTGLAGGEEREEFISLDFNQVDINLIIRFVSEITGTNFIVDPRVRGPITVISPEKIPLEAAYPVFKSILEMHGFSLVPAGEMVKIIPAVEARQQAIRTEVGRELAEIAPDDIVVTQLIPIKYADVNQVRAILTPLVSRAGNMVAHLPTNLLVLTEAFSNLERLLKVVKEIDVEGVRMEREVIPLQFASAQALAPTITSALKRRQPGKKEVGRVVEIIPQERTNCLLVIANTEDMRAVKELIEELDQEALPALSEVRIHPLENARAEELIKILNQIHANRTPARGSPLLKVEPNLVADETTNSLIIVASPQDQVLFQQVIEELDVRPNQVLVEMFIAEVSVDTVKALGIEWAAGDPPVEGRKRGFAHTDFAGVLAAAGIGFPGLVTGIIEGTVTIAGREIPKITAILQAYERYTDFEILATPHLVTSNNEQAEIMIGERIPFVREARIAEVAVGVVPTVIKTFDYRDVGIMLGITPRISRERFVRLDIEGEISQAIAVGKPAAPGAITTLERRISTVLTVEDGATVVIGGLTRDEQAETIHEVPLLGDIPILGALFRRKEDTKLERNLLIFITPHVLETAEEIEAIRQKKDLRQEELREREG